MFDLARLVEGLGRVRPGGHGVTGWSIYVSETRRHSLGIKDREAGNPHAPLTLAASNGARYLLIWDDGRISRGHLERRQLEADPAETLAFARAAAYDDPDAAEVRGPAALPDVALHDAATAAIAGGETGLVEHRLRRIRETVRAEGLRTWSGSFAATEARALLETSAGLRAAGEGTSFGWYASFNGEIGSGHSARMPEPEAEFEARLARTVDLARELERPAGARPGGRLPVLLHPKVVDDYVLSTLFHHLDGSTVAHGESRFPREAFGGAAAVLREDLFLRLDPLVPFRSGSYRFTVEGVPAARCAFIEAGRLVQPVLDVKYGRRLGLPPTPIPYSMDAVQLGGASSMSLDDALGAAGGGVHVLSVLGVHTQDSASGDFSLSAPQALWIADGGWAGRTRGTLSGNLFELLRDPELRFVAFDGETTPGLLVPCRFDPA
jgi:PmbA protein